MDGSQFDLITKYWATQASRRRVLKALASMATAGLLGGITGGISEAAPCKRPNTRCGKGKNADCTNLQSDPFNCGGCRNVCPTPANTSPTCSGGACGLTCSGGFANCDGDPATGCETNIGGDVTNCGSCGVTCIQEAGQTCVSGNCVTTSCQDSSSCGLDRVCCNGRCCRPEDVCARASGDCCDPAQLCAVEDPVYGNREFCCPADTKCCNGTCRPLGAVCCPEGQIRCATSLTGGSCCHDEPDLTCCGPECCRTDLTCCNGHCCGAGQVCARSSGDCCAPEQVCGQFGDNEHCCPAGTTCCNGSCRTTC